MTRPTDIVEGHIVVHRNDIIALLLRYFRVAAPEKTFGGGLLDKNVPYCCIRKIQINSAVKVLKVR